MEAVKLFQCLVLILACAVFVSAQDEKPKLIWENLTESYSDFENIRPHIRNSSLSPLYIYPNLDVRVEVFDNDEWSLSKYVFVTDYVGRKSPKPKPLKIAPNEVVDITDWFSWNISLLGEHGTFQPRNKVNWEKITDFKSGRKYRLIILFSEKKLKNSTECISPEIWVQPAS